MSKIIQSKAKKFIYFELIKKSDQIYGFQNLDVMHLNGAFFLSWRENINGTIS